MIDDYLVGRTERELISAMLNLVATPADAPELLPGDFDTPRLRPMWAALCALEEKEEALTPLIVLNYMEDGKPDPELRDFLEEIASQDYPGTGVVVPRYARLIRTASCQREIQRATGELSKDPTDGRAFERVRRARARLEIVEADADEIETGGLRLLTAEEFETDLAPDAIVENLIYAKSLITVNGASKAGKTYWVLQLLMSIASGHNFLGLRSEQVPVLLISLELSAGMIRERMKAIARDTFTPMPEIGDNFQIVAPTAHYNPAPLLDLGSEEGELALRSLLDGYQPKVAVLDTLYRFLPGIDPNSNQDMGKVFGGLNSIAQEKDCALIAVDHVGKGDQGGPVSHSGLGASVKGGAARAVIGLKRTTKEDGGRWEVNVESHFGSWDEPLHYERPRLEDGAHGVGCALCGPAEAYGIDLDTLERLFHDHGKTDDEGRPWFPSQRELIDALQEAGIAGNNQGAGQDIAKAIANQHGVPDHIVTRGHDRPILLGKGPRKAKTYTWRGINS